MVFLISTDVQLKKKSHHKHKDVHLDKTFPKDVKFFYTITGLCNYWVDYECASLKRDSVFVIIRPWHKQPLRLENQNAFVQVLSNAWAR